MKTADSERSAPANDLLVALLLGEIVRVSDEIRELQDESKTLNRILRQIRTDRGAIV